MPKSISGNDSLKVSTVGTLSAVLKCFWRIQGMLLLCRPSGWVLQTPVTTRQSITACLNHPVEKMCNTIMNKYEQTHETRHHYKYIQTQSGTKQDSGGLSLCPNRVLPRLCLVSAWVIMCEAGLFSELGDRADIQIHKHTQADPDP